MGMGIVNDEEFDLELGRIEKSKVSATIVKLNHGGRGLGNTGVPAELRKVIVEEAISGGGTS